MINKTTKPLNKNKELKLITKNEEKQMNLMMDDWWELQKMEKNKGYRKNKSYINKRKSLKRRAEKVDNIIKKYNKKTKKT
uniref:Uncharacterized protein n=1 Tax=viral metagenome TaxID=1070528 RepID=A0A6C0IHF0_9ZZZZ